MRLTKYIVSIALSVLAVSCKHESKEVHETSSQFCLDDRFKGSVKFIEATTRQISQGIPLTGMVESNPDRVVNFISLVGGVISNTYFSLGDQVTRGQVLAELRSTELSSLQAELKNIGSQIRVAQKKLQAVQSMFDEGIASEKDLLEAQSELDILESDKDRVNSNLNLFSASPDKDVFQVKAPVTGIITAKSIAAGSQISGEGAPLFTISDLSEVWVMVNVYATQIQNIKTDMPVEISTFSYPGEIFNGRIATVSQVYDNESRVLKARVVLPNTDLKLKPGTLVDVTALRQQDTKAVAIPTDAIVFDDNQTFVVVYKDDCDLHVSPVTVLTSNNGTSFIGDGLSEGEKVVSNNQLLIYSRLKQ